MKHGAKARPGSALGSWSELGQPDYTITTNAFQVWTNAGFAVLIFGGGSLALLIAFASIRPWYAAVILILSSGALLVPLVFGLGWVTWKTVKAEQAYICVFGDTVEVGSPNYAKGTSERFRFALDELIVAQASGPDLFRPRYSTHIAFNREVPVRIDGSPEVRPLTFIFFPWLQTSFAIPRFAGLLRQARLRRARVADGHDV